MVAGEDHTCQKKGCTEPGTVIDDDTFKKYCWSHKKGVRHQDCGCEINLEDFSLKKRCEKHHEQWERILDIVKPNRKKKKVNSG